QTNGTGVYGASSAGRGIDGSSDTGEGVSARSDNGTALSVAGSAKQTRADGGLAKALVEVYSGAILRCYNSQTNPPNSVAPCGFSIANTGAGDHTVNFGFKVDDRFISVSPLYETDGFVIIPQVRALTTNTIRIKTYKLAGTLEDSAFYLVVY
ncbi:MAG: hypothetical protein ABI847_15685, partial [Anaerolineales bacterium]